ncbi:MAG: T9SS type A sorting domain-containing protein, partial [Ignavibacteria bacterium]
FDFDSRKVFLPNETLRPPDPPISGCPIFLNHNGEQYVYENNILNRAEFPENLDQDIEDNYILKNTPLIDSVKQVIKVAVKETNDDVDYFDEISLSAIDIPPGAELGVTEYNELLIYFPQDFTGPSHAVLSGLDVIEELKFDSLSKKINGTLKDQLHLKFSNSKKNINRIQNVADSVSFIFDPAPDIMAIPDPIKRPGGRITVYDSDGNKKGDNIFAVREKSSIVVMPVAKDINTIEMMFQRVVDLSYAVVTKAYFGGYLKHDLQLVEAIDFSKGNVTELLNSIDKNYHVMDSSSFIELEFKLAVKSPPAGWNRKYLLYAAGTYKKALNNVPQKNAFENTIANNSVSFLENKLMDNFPNPFNPSTIIKYKLSGSSYVELKIYDIVGKEIRTLVKQNQNSGRYEVNFDASDLPSGIYFYKLSANDHILGFKKMMYIK